MERSKLSGFAFSIPYPKEVFKVRILNGARVMAELNPNTKLLHDAVDLIPDYGFINNPEQKRKALHEKIEAVEKMLDVGDIKGAIQKLKHNIRDKIEKWLVDYEPEPLQLSKDQILILIDEIIWRLEKIR